MCGNISLKSASVNQLEIPAPASKWHSSTKLSVQRLVSDGVGADAGVGSGAGAGVGMGKGEGEDVGVGTAAPAHLQRSPLQGHHVCPPLAHGAHCASLTA